MTTNQTLQAVSTPELGRQAPTSMSRFLVDSLKRGAWAPILVFAIHLTLMAVNQMYLVAPWIDIPMHFFGGIAIAYFFLASLIGKQAPPLFGSMSKLTIMILVISLTATTAVLWEFAEWTSDYFFASNAQIDVNDTMLDLFLGLLGSIILAVGYAMLPNQALQGMSTR